MPSNGYWFVRPEAGTLNREGISTAGAWLQDQNPEGRASLMEDARVLPEYGEASALLWINEELD